MASNAMTAADVAERPTAPLSADEYRAAIKAVQQAQRLLTFEGFGISNRSGVHNSGDEFQRRRACMFDPYSQVMFEHACRFLARIPKTKRINPRAGHSYYLKHVVEDRAATYISTGMLIAAAIHCGFKVKRHDSRSLNCDFNMASRWQAGVNS